jgi:hypothetical protein
MLEDKVLNGQRTMSIFKHHTVMIHWKERFRAAGIHLGISLVIAVAAALLVFLLWYPFPYRDISGGRELFLIVVSVDVVLGPLLTLTIFNRTKPRSELRRDLAVVGLLQLAGLVYGLWTVFVARPVHMSFEIDRFRVVHAIDVPPELVDRAPQGVVALPLTGPTYVAVRAFRNENEKMEATLAALGGVDLSARPDLWEPYDASKERVLQAARPVQELKSRFASQTADIDAAVTASGRQVEDLVYLPMVGRKSFWTVLLDRKTAQPLGYLPLDSF